MAAVEAMKKKCEFGDKCYRKNKKHREEFSHPGDEDDKAAAPSKTRIVHAISGSDDEVPSMIRRSSKRKAEEEAKSTSSTPPDTPKPSSSNPTKPPTTSKPPPAKKQKVDTSEEEKIAVDYSKGKTKKANSKAPEAAGSSKNENKKNNSPPKIIKYQEKRQKCKYWAKCYQTSDTHKEQFYHPKDEEDKEEEKNTRSKSSSEESLNPLEDGDTVEFNTGYKLKREDDIYSCTCKGFLIQRAPINERTCKHLKEYLGEEFDQKRLEASKKPKKPSIKSHIQVSVLLAKKYDETKNNPVGWWISEKLDGVRAIWTGSCFYSRLGNAFYAPDWFTKDLPKDIYLDGELFGGRGQFQSTVSIVKTAESPKWKDIKYHVFDSPRMGKETFEKRMNIIKDYFEEHQPEYAVFVEQVKCKSKEHLEEKLTKVLNMGGEGLMIRKPLSKYEATRSDTLLKIKKFYDAEAIVIGHEDSKSNPGLCGALRCRMACGKEFSVGSGLNNKDRRNPPKIGTIITYKFQEITKGGSPRFPTYVGIRIDMTEPKDAEIREVMDEDDA
ncbi:uncharacterized protein LOC131940296 [Physella acuta]|uniref:uncharacterized protein LOC131940296 n=1 Tax=Physella acuta TaxID=109671 RepID=UPI0027DCC547|nr:uncharacterized protein LOC131940296 [Physella acuta]XP_059154926.1 uncharacterized protein LOC131940296 [Physella acuta]